MSDNTLNNAKRLSLGGRAGGFVGRFDRSDFYRIDLSSPSSANLSIRSSNPKSIAQLNLYDSNGYLVRSGRRTGRKQSDITQQLLNSGIYYIEVRSRRGGTRYSLSTSGTQAQLSPPNGTSPNAGQNPPVSIRPSSDPGLSTYTAYDIGSLDNTTKSYEDVIGVTDDKDVYRFTLSSRSQLNAIVEYPNGFGASGYTVGYTSTVLLYDNTGDGVPDYRSILSSGSGGIESLSLLAEPGTYFLQITESSEAVRSYNYKFKLSATPVGESLSPDPGNARETASDIGSLARGANLQLKNFIGVEDKSDFYRFTVASPIDVTATIASSSNVSVFLETVN